MKRLTPPSYLAFNQSLSKKKNLHFFCVGAQFLAPLHERSDIYDKSHLIIGCPTLFKCSFIFENGLLPKNPL